MFFIVIIIFWLGELPLPLVAIVFPRRGAAGDILVVFGLLFLLLLLLVVVVATANRWRRRVLGLPGYDAAHHGAPGLRLVPVVEPNQNHRHVIARVFAVTENKYQVNPY